MPSQRQALSTIGNSYLVHPGLLLQDATFQDMILLARACPALKHLELLNLTTSSQTLFQPLSRLPGLAAVRLIDVAWMADAAVLASLRHVTGLTSLEISAAAASHNRDLNLVLPHLEQLSGLCSLSLSLTSESFCDLLFDIEYFYDGVHLDGQNVLGQFSSLWGLKQLTHLLWGCPCSSSGSSSLSQDEPDPYEDFHFVEAAEISVLALCTQLVSLHLASAWVCEEAADLLMHMPRLDKLVVRSFLRDRNMLVQPPVGTCNFKSLTLNSCGGPSIHAVTRLSTSEIPDLPLSDLEEILLCSGQLMMAIEGCYDGDEDDEEEDANEVGDIYTLKNRIVSSVRDLAHRLGAGCSKQGESSRFSLVITTNAALGRRYTPNANLLWPWCALAGHLRSLEIHNFPVNSSLIEELAEALPALPELRLHAADITDCGWRHMGLLSLDVLCIWGGRAGKKANAAPGLLPPSALPVPTLVQPRHLGLLGSQLTGPLVVAVGPPRFRLAAETGLEVMRALGHAAGSLITLQSLQYQAYRPRGCNGRQWREEWAREWRHGGKETGPNKGS